MEDPIEPLATAPSRGNVANVFIAGVLVMVVTWLLFVGWTLRPELQGDGTIGVDDRMYTLSAAAFAGAFILNFRRYEFPVSWLAFGALLTWSLLAAWRISDSSAEIGRHGFELLFLVHASVAVIGFAIVAAQAWCLRRWQRCTA